VTDSVYTHRPIEVPDGFEQWPIVDEDDWYQQQRHDSPEQWGTTRTYSDGTRTVVVETITTREWLDPMDGQLDIPEGTRTHTWAYEPAPQEAQ
jgi:hypothetical protein